MMSNRSKKRATNDFKEFIGRHYGTQTRLAKSLGVTTQTVQSWIKDNPRGILKYAPEIVKEKNVTAFQLMAEVIHHERYLND